MDLAEYLRVARRSWVLIVAVALAGLCVGGLATILVKPTYTSTTELFVSIQNSGSISELQQGNTFSQSRVQSYVKTATTPVVLQPVIDSLGLSMTTSQLASRISASSDLNTVIIEIKAVDSSSVQAAAIAQATADSLVVAIEKLEKPKTGGASPVGLSIVTPAAAPPSPSAPNSGLNLILGLFFGLVAGVGVALLRNSVDNRIRGEVDLRRVSDAPLLGGLAFDGDASRKPLLTQAPHQSPRAESFRQLRTNLQFANVAGRSKTVLITSSLPGEGKSTTATNLAIAMAQAGQRVVLVDADLRRPSVNEYLGLEKTLGLTTVLVGEAGLEDVIQPWGADELYVLTSGRIPPNPSELLGSAQMKDLIGELEETFDGVIIDAPPLLPVTDAAVLSQHVGGVVVVVGAQKAKQNELEKSLDALRLVGANVLGVVLNWLPASGPDAYAYGYYTATAEKPLKRRSNEETVFVGEFDEDYQTMDHQDGARPERTFPVRGHLGG